MTLSDLLALVRSRSDDTEVLPLWSDDEITAFLNEGVAEACTRARLLFDQDSSVCQVPIVYGQATYQLDPSIFEIVDAWVVSNNPQYPNNGHPLIGTSQTAMDQQRAWSFPRRVAFTAYYNYYQSAPYWLGGNWRTWKGIPIYYIQDQSRFQLVPIPVTLNNSYTESIKLAVFRVPTDMELMGTPADEPVIPSQWHARLVDWALFRMYSKYDGETYDPAKAQLAEVAFEASFGKKQDANVIRKQQQRTRRTTTSAWP